MRNEYVAFEVQLTETLAIMTPVHARELYITTTTQAKVKKRLTHSYKPTTAVISVICLIYDKKRPMKSPVSARLTDQ